MKLEPMVTKALQAANILNRTLVLENQNQGNELGEIAGLENRFEVDLLSDEMQPHKNRHAKHRKEMDAQQSLKPLDTMPDDDLRHPYSAHKPKQKHVEPPLYRKNFEESRSAQKVISNSIERTKEIFYHLKERYITEYDRERKYTQTNLQDAQSLYKDFRHLKDRLLDNESFMQEQREAIHVFLKEDSAPNRHEHLRKYLEMYNTEINNLSLDKLKIDSLIDDCEKMVNEVKEAIKNMESRSVNAFTTESPTISPQEKNILTRSKDLSTQFNKLTQEINHLRGQVEELESDMFWENQFSGHESPNRMKDIKAKLTHIRNDQLPKLEGERTFVQSEIMKEKHYIESLVREEKMSPSKAIEYRNEYEKLIHRFEESIPQLDNERNKREKVGKPSLSENTLTTATTTERPTTAINSTIPEQPIPAINAVTPEQSTLAINATTPEQPTPAKTTTTESPTISTPETYIQRRNKMLELKFDMIMQETKALNKQFLEIDNIFLSKKKVHDFTFSKINKDLSLRQDNIKDKLLPKLKNETNLLSDQIMNEKNYINSLVKTGEISDLKANEYTNEYDKLINQFEKLSKEFEVDNRRNITDKLLKQYFPNFTPTTVINKTTTESPTTSTPETYIRRRNKMLASDFSRVMEEINGLNYDVKWSINQLDFNTSLKKDNPELYKRLISDEDLNARIADIKNNKLPKLEYERDLIQSQIMNEKNYISSLVKEGKINFSEAEEYRNEYDKLINQFEKPIHDFNIDNAREKIDSLVKQSLSKYTSTIAENNKATPEKSTISTSETYIRRRNKVLETDLFLANREAGYLDRQATDEENDLKMMIQETEIKLSDIEERRARIDEIRNNKLPRLNYERGLVQSQIRNEKNYINSLVKAGKMSDVEAEEYRNEYDKLINQFEKPILDINIDNARERMDSLVKQSHSKYAPTTESPTTATQERTTTATPESNIRKRIKKLELGSGVIIKNIMALRRQVNDIEKRLIAEKKNPNHSRFSIENLTIQRENIKSQLLNLENQRTDSEPILIDEKNSIDSLVKAGKINAVEAEGFINKYNELIDKYKQPIPDINMDNNTTTTERATTTTTEAPTIFKPEEYIRRRNKVLELQFDMVIQEITYLSNKANEIEDMLFLKEQYPDLPLPNSIDVLRGQRDEIRGEQLPTLVDQRDFVQYQIMNEKDSIESLVKEGKMSAVEAEKYRNEYNKLIDKFEVPVNVFGHEFDNIRKKRDLSLEQSFSEKSANKATDKKEKPRLAEKLASIATNNKEKLEKLSVMKREPAMVR